MGQSVRKIHRFQAGLFPVNAYLVETPTAVVAVDATLGVSDGRALRERAGALGKPLAGVILTHSHPDHYGGVAALVGDTGIPVCAVSGVDRTIRRDDATKEQILRPMFGDQWPVERMFPNRIVQDGDRVMLGDATFHVIDAGPCESPHDSWWLLETDGAPQVFVGDLVYSHMHAYLADGFYEEWLACLERAKRDIPRDAMLLMGHGAPLTDQAILDWQAEYIHRVLSSLRTAMKEGLTEEALATMVTSQMKEYLPNDDLLFLLQLSVAPIRERLLAATCA